MIVLGIASCYIGEIIDTTLFKPQNRFCEEAFNTLLERNGNRRVHSSARLTM